MSTPSQAEKKRPSHLIVFDPATEADHIHKVCSSLKPSNARAAKAAKASSSGESAKSLWVNADGVEERIFDELKVASMDLTDAEISTARNDPAVRIVMENQIRRILGWITPGETSAATGPATGPATGNSVSLPGNPIGGDRNTGKSAGALGKGNTNSWPFAFQLQGVNPSNPWPWMVGNPQSSFLTAYLAGIRDLAVHISGILDDRPPSPGQGSMTPFTDSEELTWALRAIGISGNHATLQGKGVKVAVLDTGLDLNHPDFSGPNAVAAANRKSFVPQVASVQDGNGHGTHCCGVVAGPLQPASGPRYGVAPACTLMVGKVLDDSGRGWDSDILAGIQWAAASGAQIISLSLGSSREAGEDYSPAYEVVAQSLRQGGRGVLLITAAGNDSARDAGRIAPVGNPAACPSFMAVGAVDASRSVANFSCGQQDQNDIGRLDLCAPGVGVHSSVPNSIFGKYHIKMNGTSMATPHVAGVAALYLEAEPRLSVEELWSRLETRAIPLPLRSPLDYGSGLVQVP